MTFGKKSRNEILQNYKQVKSSVFDFEKIALLFNNKEHADVHQVLVDRTLQDLDFEELFMYLDRTCSSVGQQVLYDTLRTIPKNSNCVDEIEKVIQRLKDNSKVKESAVLQLSKLNETGAYYIQSLIFGDYIEKPKWYWIIPLMSVFSLANLVLSIFYPVFVLLFIPVLTVNLMLHFWNKKNILSYSNSIPQLMMLNKVAGTLLKSGVINDMHGKVKKAQECIRQTSKAAIFYKFESLKVSEFGQLMEFMLELIKITFLLEPILIFRIIERLSHKRTEIHDLLFAVASVDVAISIDSFRESLPYFTHPKVQNGIDTLQIIDLFHPLLIEPVANSLELSNGKSVLISGSNMSGKTTFIRAVGINCLLAQTINTACARSINLPPLRIFSAIRISDDLMDETSYYHEEVKTIKDMLAESDSGERNIFLLDEIFKGTNTVERIASGKAVLSFLSLGNNTVLVSTHDLELIELLKDSYSFSHFSDSVENNALNFDYKLKPGRLENTNAIKILEINGFPETITNEARKLAKVIQDEKEAKLGREY